MTNRAKNSFPHVVLTVAPTRPYRDGMVRLQAATEEAREAEARLREAVAAARVDGHSWAEIGEVLDISRQAARDRFAASERIVNAWAAIEDWAERIAVKYGWPVDTVEVLKRLRAEDDISEGEFALAAAILDVRNRTVHASPRHVPVGDILDALDDAVAVAGALAALAVRRPSRSA